MFLNGLQRWLVTPLSVRIQLCNPMCVHVCVCAMFTELGCLWMKRPLHEAYWQIGEMGREDFLMFDDSFQVITIQDVTRACIHRACWNHPFQRILKNIFRFLFFLTIQELNIVIHLRSRMLFFRLKATFLTVLFPSGYMFSFRYTSAHSAREVKWIWINLTSD